MDSDGLPCKYFLCNTKIEVCQRLSNKKFERTIQCTVKDVFQKFETVNYTRSKLFYFHCKLYGEKEELFTFKFISSKL